ncbi:hypothetical protein Syun_001305 [Stephania yunnanensis]|uniref:Uncharacterized protein n=1 Tax=Stephania yunnanensis TaxID=152371 RepID=A0AAP0Q6C4_9MAGN
MRHGIDIVTIERAHISGPNLRRLHNRKSKKGGPGTSPLKHTSGIRYFQTYEDILVRVKALDKDEDNEVTPNDVFLHVQTKDHDGLTFIDSRSAPSHFSFDDFVFVMAKLLMRREEHTQATPGLPIDEE